MTRLKIELAIREKDKKLMSCEFEKRINQVISDKKTLKLLSESYKVEQKR